jgi:hypothetical protein
VTNSEKNPNRPSPLVGLSASRSDKGLIPRGHFSLQVVCSLYWKTVPFWDVTNSATKALVGLALLLRCPGVGGEDTAVRCSFTVWREELSPALLDQAAALSMQRSNRTGQNHGVWRRVATLLPCFQ